MTVAEAAAAEDAFLGLRHICPEIVRLIRAALDVGGTPAELKHLHWGRDADRIALVIDHMAAHPEAGRVVWGDGSYTWAALREGS